MRRPEPFDATVISGFLYRQNLFSAAEETAFIALFKQLPFKPFEFRGYQGRRRVVSFGFRYDYGARRLRVASPFPVALEPLKTIAAELSGLETDSFVHALITEYAPGAGIGWHRDKPMFRNIVALSFGAPCRLRFRRRFARGWERKMITIEPRSGYCLSGHARNVWEHSIPPMDGLRYSITFRDFEPDYSGADE